MQQLDVKATTMKQWGLRWSKAVGQDGEYQVKVTIFDMTTNAILHEETYVVSSDTTTQGFCQGITRRANQWFLDTYPTVNSLPDIGRLTFGFPDVLATCFYF